MQLKWTLLPPLATSLMLSKLISSGSASYDDTMAEGARRRRLEPQDVLV